MYYFKINKVLLLYYVVLYPNKDIIQSTMYIQYIVYTIYIQYIVYTLYIHCIYNVYTMYIHNSRLYSVRSINSYRINTMFALTAPP